MLPRFSRPPERNAAEWLAAFKTSPRLGVVDKIASDLARAPGKLFDRRGGEEREITSHPFLDFWAKPNPMHEYTAAAIWRLSEIYLTLKGESFLIIERDASGLPRELWPIPPHWAVMTPYVGNPSYMIRTPSGLMITVPMADVFVMKDLNPLDPAGRGLGRAEALADEVEIDEFAAKFQKAFFYNDATPSTILIMPGAKPDQLERAHKQWLDRFRGPFKSHGMAVVDSDLRVERISSELKDLDMVGGRTFARDVIHEHFGVPPEIMGIVSNSNRATIESAQFIYAQNVLMPRLRAREEAVNAQLVAQFGDGLVWRFDDIVPRNQEFNKAKALEGWNAGLLTLDEAREMLDMPSASSGGDVYKTGAADIYVGADEDRTALASGGMDMGAPEGMDFGFDLTGSAEADEPDKAESFKKDSALSERRMVKIPVLPKTAERDNMLAAPKADDDERWRDISGTPVEIDKETGDLLGDVGDRIERTSAEAAARAELTEALEALEPTEATKPTEPADKPGDQIEATSDNEAEAEAEAETTKPDVHKPEQMTVDDKQFGDKFGRHAQDYGLDRSSPEARQWFRDEIHRIYDDPDRTFEVDWRSQAEKPIALLKGNDVLLLNKNGEFITLMKDGINNERVRRGMRTSEGR
jgi:HK97 family phage portal protein